MRNISLFHASFKKIFSYRILTVITFLSIIFPEHNNFFLLINILIVGSLIYYEQYDSEQLASVFQIYIHQLLFFFSFPISVSLSFPSLLFPFCYVPFLLSLFLFSVFSALSSFGRVTESEREICMLKAEIEGERLTDTDRQTDNSRSCICSFIPHMATTARVGSR